MCCYCMNMLMQYCNLGLGRKHFFTFRENEKKLTKGFTVFAKIRHFLCESFRENL
jgi:hypothetical protein